MPEFDPGDRDRQLNEPRKDDPLMRNAGSGIGPVGMLAAVAFAIMLGLVFWNLADNRIASNTSPGVTTGTSPTTPAPTSPPKDTNTPPASR